jgi:putative hydrolase of the HAD superfamily
LSVPVQPGDPIGQRRQRVWLFDLDNTLHDASSAVFGDLKAAMTRYIETELQVDRQQADLLRFRYWQRYGATLLGLIKHHGVSAAHFLRHTHALPGLEGRVFSPAADRAALRRLPGRRYVLTNAPRVYAHRVLGALGLLQLFDGIICIEDMAMFGHLRPKPDARMMRRMLAKLRAVPARTTLVEDTLEHQKAARRVGMKTVWMQRFLRTAGRQPGAAGDNLCRIPAYVDRRLARLRDL